MQYSASSSFVVKPTYYWLEAAHDLLLLSLVLCPSKTMIPDHRGDYQHLKEVRPQFRKVHYSVAELYVKSAYLNIFQSRGAQAMKVWEPLTYM
jgi:hypothetical protein